MDIDPIIPGLGMAIASLAVFGLMFHYLRRAGKQHDILCLWGLNGVAMGLLVGAVSLREASGPITPLNLFSFTGMAFFLCSTAFMLWREGLRRLRDAELNAGAATTV